MLMSKNTVSVTSAVVSPPPPKSELRIPPNMGREVVLVVDVDVDVDVDADVDVCEMEEGAKAWTPEMRVRKARRLEMDDFIVEISF